LAEPTHPREPLEAFADDGVEPDVTLDDGQREALGNLIGDFNGTVGLADLGEGYAKVLFYDVDGNVVHTELLWALYGDAAMPEFKHWN
jgi:hypothetical protein